jgi:hypothetical protein
VVVCAWRHGIQITLREQRIAVPRHKILDRRGSGFFGADMKPALRYQISILRESDDRELLPLWRARRYIADSLVIFRAAQNHMIRY